MNEPLLVVFPAVAIALVIGFGLYRLVAPKGRPTTAIQMGREWYGWMALISTMTFFPELIYRPFSLDSLAIWLIIGLGAYGGIAFSLGWAYGKFRFRDTPPVSVVHSGVRPSSVSPIEGSNIPSGSSNAVNSDEIYAAIALEMETDTIDKGLWTRLYAECDGDEKQTKVLYIKRRADRLIAAEKSRFVPATEAQSTRTFSSSNDDMEHLEKPILAVRYIEKYHISKDKLAKAIAHGEIRGTLRDGVLWVEDKKI